MKRGASPFVLVDDQKGKAERAGLGRGVRMHGREEVRRASARQDGRERTRAEGGARAQPVSVKGWV